MNAITYYQEKTSTSKNILKNINHFGTVTIHLEGYFLFSLIKSDNDIQKILVFDTIEFNNVDKFKNIFNEFNNKTRWFSNMVNNDTLIFNEYFSNIGYEFHSHNLKSTIEDFYYTFQGYLNTKEVIMNSEVSKTIKNNCKLDKKDLIDGGVDFIPSPQLFNLMYGFKNIQNPISYIEYDTHRLGGGYN